MLRKATAVLLSLTVLLVCTPFLTHAAAPAPLLPAFAHDRWKTSVGVEQYVAYDPAASWLDITSTPTGGVVLRRSALCPDHYAWPRMTYDQPMTLALLLTPYVYFDIQFSPGMENAGWMIQLTFNGTQIIPLPQAMARASGRIPPANVTAMGTSGRFTGRLNLRELIEEYRPALVRDTHILELTRCDIILMDEGRHARLTVHSLHFGLLGPSSWAVNEVVLAKTNNLSSDSVERDYQTPITRAQYAELSVLLYERLTGKSAQLPAANPFTDTSDPVILKAYHTGIVQGVGNSLFAPERTITREELALMLQRTVSIAAPENYAKVPIEQAAYEDYALVRSWAREAVDFVTAAGIMQGSGNRFNPRDVTSCEQAILTNWRSFNQLR
jgi:hypothetical protein